MDENDIKDMIKQHEGKRLEVYKDTVGVLTAGYGHALHVGTKISQAQADEWFDQDYSKAANDYDRLDWDLDPVRRAVCINMIYNLGLAGLMRFTRFTMAISMHDYQTASKEMLDSLWARQVGKRAQDLAMMMSMGEEV